MSVLYFLQDVVEAEEVAELLIFYVKVLDVIHVDIEDFSD